MSAGFTNNMMVLKWKQDKDNQQLVFSSRDECTTVSSSGPHVQIQKTCVQKDRSLTSWTKKNKMQFYQARKTWTYNAAYVALKFNLKFQMSRNMC